MRLASSEGRAATPTQTFRCLRSGIKPDDLSGVISKTVRRIGKAILPVSLKVQKLPI
jgi:hypothetical protein